MANSPAALLDEALQRSGLSARELSRRTGVSEGRISDYRSGRHDPGAVRLLQLLAAAGLRVRVEPNLDRNGLHLGELLELSDALFVGMRTKKEERLASFFELTGKRG